MTRHFNSNFLRAAFLVVICIAVPLVVTVATAAPIPASRPVERNMSAQTSRVVFFRLGRPEEASKARPVPINVYFDGTYHASLMPDTRALEVIACPGTSTLRAASGALLPHDKVQPAKTLEAKLAAGGTYYYQVAFDTAGAPQLRPVEASRVSELVASLPKNVRTISRTRGKRCG